MASRTVEQEIDSQLVRIARLVTAPAGRAALERFPHLTVASDLHNNILALPALAGMLAEDDPEGRRILEQVYDDAGDDPDIFVLTNVGNMEVNALQRSADIVLQKSLKEGFGLVVAEALWKARPVVAGAVGGIAKFGAGRLVLPATNSYQGSTVVEAG